MSVSIANIIEGSAAGAIAGLVAGSIIAAVTLWIEYRDENARIEYIRRELKYFKKSSDDIHGKEGLDFPEQVMRREMYNNMRRIIKPVSSRLSHKKQLELNQTLDWDYKELLLIRGDGTSPKVVEGEWPTDGIHKHQIDKIFKRLEGLKWLKINK